MSTRVNQRHFEETRSKDLKPSSSRTKSLKKRTSAPPPCVCCAYTEDYFCKKKQ